MDLQLRFNYHRQALRNSLATLMSKPVATLMTIIVIALTLALPASFWAFSNNMIEWTSSWKKNSHISLFLKMSLPSTDTMDLLTRVKNTPGVQEANLTSSAEGLVELQSQEGMQDIMNYLSENPLPAVIDVTPAFNINTPEALESLYHELKSYTNVEDAKLDMEWVHRLYDALDFVGMLANMLMILLAFIVILIIGNTLRLTIHERYEEIQVLKLIGATDSFILRPFLYSGIGFGLMAALISLLLVSLFLSGLEKALNQLVFSYQMHFSLSTLSFQQSFMLICFAMILGWLGARLSVKRQLGAIETCS